MNIGKFGKATDSAGFTAERDGFYGRVFYPLNDTYPEKALILFGGSDGNFVDTCKIAKFFVDDGLTVLALAFWNAPGLPDTLSEVPVESVERAALWLNGHGYGRTALWGISMGAEYALLAGSLLPGLVKCVVAVCPMDAVNQGISKKGGKPRPLDTSVFSWRGAPLPYFTLDTWSMGRVLKESVRSREFTMAFAYRDGRSSAPSESVIPVERISGPVLLISAKEDAMWPSSEAGERVIARLDANDFPYPHRHLVYEYGSHLMIPKNDPVGKIFRVERQHPAECLRDKEDSFRQTLRFLKEW